MTVWVVYMLRCADRTLYTGITTDVAARLAAHHAGRGAKYLRGRLPAVLVYCEAAMDHAAALRREYAIKRLSAAAKQRLIASAKAQAIAPPISMPARARPATQKAKVRAGRCNGE